MTRRDVPQWDVHSPGRQGGGDSEAKHCVSVTRKVPHKLPRPAVPQVDGAVSARGDQLVGPALMPCQLDDR